MSNGRESAIHSPRIPSRHTTVLPKRKHSTHMAPFSLNITRFSYGVRYGVGLGLDH